MKVLKETCVSTNVTKSSFEGMVSMVLATNQFSFTDDELPPEGRELLRSKKDHSKISPRKNKLSPKRMS